MQIAKKRLKHYRARHLSDLRGYHDLRAKIQDISYFTRHAAVAANMLRVSLRFRPDVIHCHDIYPLPAAIALGRLHKARVIYDAHEIETERVPPLPSERKSFIAGIESSSADDVDALITVSAGCRAFYDQVFSRTELVMNIPEPSREEANADDVREMCGVGGTTPLIVYTGAISGKHRGLDKVVRALPLLPEAHLVVLGPRHSISDPWLQGIADEEGVASRVHLLPPVDASAVPATIRNADVAICPIQDATLSYRHSMPNKLFEAAYSGLPICVSNLPDMAAFVRNWVSAWSWTRRCRHRSPRRSALPFHGARIFGWIRTPPNSWTRNIAGTRKSTGSSASTRRSLAGRPLSLSDA